MQGRLGLVVLLCWGWGRVLNFGPGFALRPCAFATFGPRGWLWLRGQFELHSSSPSKACSGCLRTVEITLVGSDWLVLAQRSHWFPIRTVVLARVWLKIWFFQVFEALLDHRGILKALLWEQTLPKRQDRFLLRPLFRQSSSHSLQPLRLSLSSASSMPAFEPLFYPVSSSTKIPHCLPSPQDQWRVALQL